MPVPPSNQQYGMVTCPSSPPTPSITIVLYWAIYGRAQIQVIVKKGR